MPGTLPTNYGTANQPLTVTVISLANGAARGSTAVDNTVNKFQDAFVAGKVKTNAASTSATGTVVIYAYGTADGGTTYQEGFNGVDGAVTLTVPPNARPIAFLNTVANATTYYLPPTSVAQVFGGSLPDHWGIFVENKSGAALDASVGNFWYQGTGISYT